MSTATINVRLDAELKKQFEDFCNDVGMSVSTAINLCVRRIVKDNKLPFEISSDIPNEETLAAIEEVKRMRADPNLGKTYTDVDQMMEEILADA